RTPVTQHEPGGLHLAAAFVMAPPTIVIHGPPRSAQPPNGVLRLLEWNRDGLTVVSASRSRMVTSPGAPTEGGPPGGWSRHAGSRLHRAIKVARGSRPPPTSRPS